jgi:acetyltransferase
MSTYRLDKLFAPLSIAVVGGSPRATSPGRAVIANLKAGGFEGPLAVVNPHYPEIEGIRTVPSLTALQQAPDLVVIAAPATEVPAIIGQAGEKGTPSAIIITSGLGHGEGSLAATCEKTARATGLRLVGPNCLGVMAPHARLNASFAAHAPQPGDLALISQSGAVAAGLVEWAAHQRIGFSGIVSLGDSIDVDFGDLLDYFAVDRRTRAILLYVESIRDARKFMSAARAAARVKPVLVAKAGRHAQGAKAALTHTGALAGSDAVYDAAFRRAGLLRVLDLDELFAAAETLGRLKPFAGARLAILTNGGGIGVLAVDRLADLGGTLATLSAPTTKALNAAMPPIWSGANPVDIAGDADPARYAKALEALLDDKDNDAVLVMNVPTALASSAEAAKSVVAVTQQHRNTLVPAKPVLAVWVGGDPQACAAFDAAGIPNYTTESEAIGGFMHLVRYRQAIDALMTTPPSLPQDFAPDVARARAIVENALREGRNWLDPIEIADLFACYALPITPAKLAPDADAAVAAAAPFLNAGQAIVLKIQSPDIVHKVELGGVRLNLTDADAVHDAATDILARARALRPDARITGVAVFPMITRPGARELIAGLADDPTFGPVIVFGQGGTAVEIVNDKALALPPLDLALAQALIARTRVSRLLKAYRNVKAVDENAVALVLVKLAQLAADLPQVREIDLNPLLADERGVIALDARVAIAPVALMRPGPAGHPRFAIRPYPKEWERPVTLRDGTHVLIRPIRPEDEALYAPFFAEVTEQDLRLRFFAPIKEFSHAFVARLTQLDYARAMAFIAIDAASGAMLGVVRLHANANYDAAEYAVLVRSDFKGRGLGWLLMQIMIDYASAEGLQTVEGQVLHDNVTMIAMCRELGFAVAPDPQDPDLYVVTLAVPKREVGG